MFPGLSSPLYRCHRARRGAGAAMALSKLSGDEQCIIFVQLCNALDTRVAVYFSSASSELRALLTPAVRQQLRADHEAAAALCVKMEMESCKELREANGILICHSDSVHDGLSEWLSEADLATLGTLG